MPTRPSAIRRRQHWAWTAAAAVLALALLSQFVHHSRQSLVAHPWFERPMRALYGVFGVTLEPKWDLGAYDVRQPVARPWPAPRTRSCCGPACTIARRTASRRR